MARRNRGPEDAMALWNGTQWLAPANTVQTSTTTTLARSTVTTVKSTTTTVSSSSTVKPAEQQTAKLMINAAAANFSLHDN